MSTTDKRQDNDKNLKDKIEPQKLTEIKQQFRTFLNHINEAIFIICIEKGSERGIILEANEVACKRLGYTYNEMLTLSVYDVDLHKYRELNEKFGHYLEVERCEFETIHISKKGKKIPTQIRNQRYVWAGREVMISVARNITDRKQVEGELSKKNKVEELRTEFFANISHELKTPLNVILGSIQLLEPAVNTSKDIQVIKKAKYLKIMKQNCFRLLRLINNFIDFTKVESSYLELDIRNYNIVNIIEEITLSIADYVADRGISLLFDTEVEDITVAFDADKIERIMLNLLSNAIKFTNPGGSIYVIIETLPNGIVIKIKDTGIGIPQEKVRAIFERFTQVEGHSIRNHEGSGIGLSLVRSLVNLHGGEITCNSVCGEGTEFIVVLPIKVVETKEVSESNVYRPNIEQIKLEFSDIYTF
jgi:PAS domain S-box-containing protein